MTSGFPPIPVYPKGYDDDSTLFLVYNTSETVTTANNAPWAEEILIKPVAAMQPEIWADNGFANIEGELFYYDSVEKDTNSKVYKLKRCARNLGGMKTQHNNAGSEVRGFVIAEHHNQIVDAILNVEGFVGENFTTNQSTLDWRIRCLQAVPVIFDDFTCPDVTFSFIILSSDPATGVLAQYNLTIDGSFTAFRLDFGDGNFTTSTVSGTHRYASNSNIDPIVTVINNNCTLVQSPIERTNPTEPPVVQPVEVFEVIIPTIPQLPPFIFPAPPLPQNAFNIPPIVFPCLDIGPIGPINIPSEIIIDPPINLPSIITISPISIPSLIVITPPTITISPISIPSIIVITPPINIPSIITITPINIPVLITITPVNIPTSINVTIPPINIPSIITITPVIIPTIITITPVIIPTIITIVSSVIIPTIINIGSFPKPPPIPIGPMPPVKPIPIGPMPPCCTIKIGPMPPVKPIPIGSFPAAPTVPIGSFPKAPTILIGAFPAAPTIQFGSAPPLTVTWSKPPTLTCNVTVSCPASTPMMARSHALGTENFQDGFSPLETEIQTNDLGIPSEIHLMVPEIPDIRVIHDIPAMIEVIAPKIPPIRITGMELIPKEIKVVAAEDLPRSITLVGIDIPKIIILDSSNMPTVIRLEVPENFPKSIILDASNIPDKIQVVGIPPSIELIGTVPSEIKLVMPDRPEIELVYKGAPIEMKIQLDTSKLTGQEENLQCVAIVPCSTGK